MLHRPTLCTAFFFLSFLFFFFFFSVFVLSRVKIEDQMTPPRILPFSMAELKDDSHI